LLLGTTSLPGRCRCPLVMMRGNIDRASGTSWRMSELATGRMDGGCVWPVLYGKWAVGQACVMDVELEVELLHAGFCRSSWFEDAWSDD